MKPCLGHLYCLVSHLKRGLCFPTYCKVFLPPELDRGAKPAFSSIHKRLQEEWDLSFLKSKKVQGKIQ